MRKKLFSVLTVLTAAVFLGSAAHGATLKIGVAGPLTGDQAAFGEMLKNGATLAVEEWNAKGGVSVGGKKMKVDILWGDDRHDPGKGCRSRTSS